MAIDMFLDLGAKIPGEAKDSVFKDKIDVDSCTWIMEQPSAGKVDIKDLSINKRVDKSSPVLMLYCANGDRIPDATLTVRRAGGQALDYIVFKLQNVRVTSVTLKGGDVEDHIDEVVALAFTHVSASYTPQKPDGSGDAAVEFVWDLDRNVSE